MCNFVKIYNPRMVKLDIFFLKTQSKCIDKTLMKKLFQQLKLNEFYQLLKKAHVFLFFFVPKSLLCIFQSAKYAEIRFSSKSNKWIWKLDMQSYHITQITIYPLSCPLLLPQLPGQIYAKINI